MSFAQIYSNLIGIASLICDFAIFFHIANGYV